MEKGGISKGKFIAGIVIAILASSAVSAGISTQLLTLVPQGPQGEKGETGQQGATGATGPTGANGAMWWNGTGTPTASLGSNGDFYLNLANGDVYNRISGSWSKVANIQGPTGATGVQGPQGPPGGLYAPSYDSGWVDITDKAGQGFTLTHNLSSTNVLVDVTGLMTQADAPHQFYLGLTSYTSGFEQAYGNTTTTAYDTVNSMVQTADGGYAIAGGIVSMIAGGTSGIYLIKTDAAGTIEWNKTYGGDSNRVSLVQTTDGGYAIAGTTGFLSGGFNTDFLLLKTDASGGVQWNRTYGGTYFDDGYSVVQTADGGYALTGYTDSYGVDVPTQSNVYLVKTDASGNMQWNKTYGIGIGYSVIQATDGGYVIAGNTYLADIGIDGVYLVKTDADGNMQWSKTYGRGAGHSVVQATDGGFAVAGLTWVPDHFGDIAYLVKTDAAGTIQWNKTYGGSSITRGNSLVQTADGGYAIAGYIYLSGASNFDVYLIKADSAGSLQWDKTYGGTNGDNGYSMVQTKDGGYAIAGYTIPVGGNYAQIYLVKTAVESGLAWINTANTIVLYRGETDVFWNYVRVRIWKIE